MRGKVRALIKEDLIFYLTGGLLILGLKGYYSQADCDSLRWILAPVAKWVELLSGIEFTYIPGTGYVNRDLRLWIADSCSGVGFLILLAAMMIFSFVHRAAGTDRPADGKYRSGRLLRGFCWIGGSVFCSWIVTVPVNGLRIIAAIYLPQYLERAGLMGDTLTPERLHTAIGILIYFTALLTFYRLTDLLLQSRERSGAAVLSDAGRIRERNPAADFVKNCAPPVFWYFFMVLGIPLLHSVFTGSRDRIWELAALTACCLAAVLLFYGLTVCLSGSRKE